MPDDISRPATAPPTRIVVADDNPVVRAGLTALLAARDDMEVVGEAKDGRQAYEQTSRTRPDVVLLDVRMPGVDGLSALPHLVRLAPVLMMTYSRESDSVREAVRLGAGGYLVHGEFTAGQLITAVQDIARGRSPFSRSASLALRLPATPVAVPAPGSASERASFSQVAGSEYRSVESRRNLQEVLRQPSSPQGGMADSLRGWPESAPLHSELSRREVEVMDLIASGMTNQEIAAACFISQKTVKNHINRIFAKLNAGSRAEAIARWRGIVRGESAGNG